MIRFHRTINHRDLMSMNLFCSDRRQTGEAKISARVAMNMVQPPQRLRLVMCDFDSGHSANERVLESAQRRQGAKPLDRDIGIQSTCVRRMIHRANAYFENPLGRVVVLRVVVVVVFGGRRSSIFARRASSLVVIFSVRVSRPRNGSSNTT